MIPRGTPPWKMPPPSVAPCDYVITCDTLGQCREIADAKLEASRLRILVLLQRHVQQEFRRMALELLELLDHERAHPLASSCWNDPREAREREIRQQLSEIQRSESQA